MLEQKYKGVTKVIENTAAAQAKAADQQWFAKHPGEIWHIREIVPGEFEPEYLAPKADDKAYAYRRPDGTCYRVPLGPSEIEEVQSGALLIYPAVIDGVWKWLVGPNPNFA